MWRKSTFSGDAGCIEVSGFRKSTKSSPNGNCVEVGEFTKATFSGPNGSCVEVADGVEEHKHVRDSKDPDGPQLCFTSQEWEAFLLGVKAGEFDA